MTLATDLMPHQADAVDKMLPLRVGALFMEMGTGKSRTAIELACRRFKAGKIKRVIWFCPVSTKMTIEAEIRKHVTAPSIHRFDHKTEEGRIPEAFWYIVGLESMSSSARVILAVSSLVDNKTMVILDESSYIKGHKAERTKWITNVSHAARYRMILTGTPVSQGVVDLFSQFRFLDDRIIGLSSFYSFGTEYLEYSDRRPGMIVGYKNLNRLSAKLAPYSYQITKDECLTLPEKLRDTFYCCLTDDQKEAYAKVKKEFEEAATALYEENEPDWQTERSISIEIFRMFSRLQQVTCGWLDGEKLESDRTEVLMTALDRIPDNEKIIIWTKFRFTIPEIVEAVKAKGWSVCEFHGGLNEKQRNESLDKFRGDTRILVATTQSGGHGLTLNESAYVIFYNNEFKYATRAQAEDRNHRVGQTRKVTYVDIVAGGTIDDKIIEALAAKKSFAEVFRDKIKKVRDKTKIREALKAL